QVVESDQLFSIENVIGSNHSETINGNSQANTLDGRGGDDILNGGAGDDTYVVIGRNGGNDRFFDASGAADKVLISSFLDIFDSEQDGNDLVVTTGSGSFRVVDHFNGHPIETIVDSGTGESMVLATGLVGGLQPGIISGSNADETLDGRGGDDFL